MPLYPLRVPTARSETNFLQPIFDNWSKRRERVQLGGAPRWLLDVVSDNEQAQDRRFEAFGYSFVVDVLWRLPGERRLIELKNAWKYEPLALAEILHHAHLVRLCESGLEVVKPTILGRYNAWTRSAIRELLDHGLHSDSLEYLEFDHLRDDATDYIWIDSPLSPWQPLERAPSDLAPLLTDGWRFWYRVEHTNSWVGTQEQLGAGRPLFLPTRFTMVAPIDGRAGEYLVWQGRPPTLGMAAGHDWDDSFSRYAP